MLKRENYELENIAEIRKSTGADPTIIERTVFAFGLLEESVMFSAPKL